MATQFLIATTHASALPGWIDLAHRHLEKAAPTAPDVRGGARIYPIPIDLLRLGNVIPPALVEGIASIELEYR
jgi:hypothetical protein